MKPIGVVIPRNADDVQAAIEVAAKHGVPMLPRCGGTSLAGQGVNTGLVLDFSKHMNQLLEVNAEEGWARVQPGIVLDHLNRQLYSHGYHYAPDPTTSNPRLRRWGHRQQHLRLPLSDLRQDRRPRHGSPDCPLRRQPGPFRPHRRLRAGGQTLRRHPGVADIPWRHRHRPSQPR